jgi:DNA-directed RNA polymerase subunit RPC12/RpoP
MCECATAKLTTTPQFEKKFTLAQFFDEHWENYTQNPKHFIKPEQYKAVNAIRLCRTDALGKDIYACKDCGDTFEIRHNCKNRFCPTCSWKDTLKWGERMQKSLLAVPHRHVVMTLPHSLNPLVMCNQKELTNALLEISANLMTNHLLKSLGLKAGVIAVLHTFGEKKNLHLHVHMIVSWGGESVNDGTLKSLENPYINYNQLKEFFKNKYLKRIRKVYYKNELNHRFENEMVFEKFMEKLDNHKWILHLEPPMKIPTQVITYIGRYSKRACISEYKITDIDGEYISFRHKDYKEKNAQGKIVEKILKLHYNEFFPLLLQHVPIPYFRLVRYYGAYNSRSKINKKYLFVNQNQEIESEILNHTILCKSCNGEMIYTQTEVNRRNENWVVYKKLELLNRKNKSLKIAG